MKTYIGSHTVGWGVGTAVCLCLSPPEGGPKSLKNKRLRQRGWFDPIFMNLIMAVGHMLHEFKYEISRVSPGKGIKSWGGGERHLHTHTHTHTHGF